MLNADLSKKVQEFKMAVNAADKELIRTRNELMAEKLKSSELRRALHIMNSQCTDFLNAYMMNLQKCIERTDLEITMPGATQTNHIISDGAGCSSDVNQGAIQFRPIRVHQPNETNILNTIHEETGIETRFDVNGSMVSSTPLTQAVLRDTQNLQPPGPYYPEKDGETSTAATRNPTPKRLSLPKKTSRGTLPLTHRMSEDSSSEEEEELHEKAQDVTRRQNNTRRQNVTVELCREDCEEVTDVSQAELSISKYQLKELTVNVTKVQATSSTLNRYAKAFISSPKEVSVTIEDKREEVKENIRESSIESTLTTASFASFATSVSSSQISRVTRKRKAVSEVPRRSTGRPKRKARLVIATLAEKPINRKMRRSK